MATITDEQAAALTEHVAKIVGWSALAEHQRDYARRIAKLIVSELRKTAKNGATLKRACEAAISSEVADA